MTLRRYAPLALALAAVGCKPDIEKRANDLVVDYAVFNPSASQIPLPNDIAIQSFLATDPGPGALPCSYFLPDARTAGLCAFARGGGFPPGAASASIQIQFSVGRLGSDGTVTYVPSSLDVTSIHYAALGATEMPNLAVIDATLFSGWVLALASNPAAPPPSGLLVPVTLGRPYDTSTGTLTLSPITGTWTAGHKYVAIVRGGDSGVLNNSADIYMEMPTLFILREAVLNDLDLQLPENQALFPGTAEEKMAAGAQLEPLRVGYQGVLQITQALALLGIDIPFAELVSIQSFQIAPDATLTVGDLAASDPATPQVTGGAVAMLDAFTLTSSVDTATLTSVVFALAQGSGALSNLFLSAASDCSGTPLGTSAPITANGPVAIPFTHWLSVGNVTPVTAYVCATTKTVAAPTTVAGGVVVTSANAVGGLVFVPAGSDDSATLTVNP